MNKYIKLYILLSMSISGKPYNNQTYTNLSPLLENLVNISNVRLRTCKWFFVWIVVLEFHISLVGFIAPGFIEDFVSQLPHPFDTDWLSMLFMTIDSEIQGTLPGKTR